MLSVGLADGFGDAVNLSTANPADSSAMAPADIATSSQLDQATGGIVITDILGDDGGRPGDVLPDGSYVQGGTSDVGYFTAVKYKPDGTLDTSWGDGGKISYYVGGDVNSIAYAGATAQPDGRVILAGRYNTSKFGIHTSSVVLLRYDASGKIDKTFNRGKIVKTSLGSNTIGYAHRTLIQPDGKIVVTGMIRPYQEPYRMLLIRYNANGSLDSSFGNSGKVTSSFIVYDGHTIPAAALQGNKILVGARAMHTCEYYWPGGEDWPNCWDYYMMVARFNSDGSEDTSFGNSGIAALDFYLYAEPAVREQIRDMVVQPDNKIVVGGFVGGAINSWYGDLQGANGGIARLNADGSIDTSFGDNGYVIEDFFANDPTLFAETVQGVSLLPDGRIVAVGAHMDLEASIESTLISILNPDGTPDLWMDGPAGNAFGAKVDSQGRIIYFGQVDAPDGHDFLAMRLFDDLTLDPSFGVPAPPPSGITVTPTSGLMTTEDGGSDTFTVVLDSQPTADVTIAISSGDSSEGVLVGADELGFVALAFDQYNWSQPQTVTVTGVDDSDPDGDVAYTVVLGAATSADPAYNGLNAADVSLTNLDNEGQSNVFASEDVPKTIADPHPVKGVKPVTSQLVIASTGITVDLIDVDLMIAHASMSDLTVTLKSPGNTTADLFYDGADWYLAEPAAFKDESLDGTWVLAVTDNQRNGITGTLTAWSIAPLTQGAASQGETLSVADLYFLDLGLNSKKDSHKSNPLASQAADELALMLVE